MLFGKGARTGQQFPQHHGERIHVAAAVEFIRFARWSGLYASICSGDMYAKLPPKYAAGVAPSSLELKLTLKSTNFGAPFRRQQHIGRFDIAMQHAAPMGIIKRRRQPRTNPANGFRPRSGGQATPRSIPPEAIRHGPKAPEDLERDAKFVQVGDRLAGVGFRRIEEHQVAEKGQVRFLIFSKGR